MTAARRLAAILAADVVGYSRLMGEDEAGTARAVSERREAARPIVANHGGRIVKTTGDGLLLEFPSVVAAVECAIAIQKLMAERNGETPEDKRILCRIGVNLGDVLIDGDDILGDGVNIAARLEGVCEPGGVFVSGAAYDHVRGRIDATFVDLGEKNFKNIARPVRVYAIRADAEIAPSSPAPTRPEPPRLSIVVLPLANLSGDPEQDYFVDGVTESFTTDLSCIAGARERAANRADRGAAGDKRLARRLRPSQKARRRLHDRQWRRQHRAGRAGYVPLLPRVPAGGAASHKSLRLRLDKRFVAEARTPKRRPLDAPSPFEATRVLDPAPDVASNVRAIERMKAIFPAAERLAHGQAYHAQRRRQYFGLTRPQRQRATRRSDNCRSHRGVGCRSGNGRRDLGHRAPIWS